ncbi:MAG: TM1266 family iron-only hydrogenase system putative regulator [Clostridia bacterium]
METRIALIGIIIENKESVERLNAILHEYSQYIIGRMGIPNAKQGVAVISIVLDAPNDTISALSGKLGMLPQVSAKTIFSKMPVVMER